MARLERNVIVETKTSRSIGDCEAYLRAMIDALPHEVAVLDSKGFVVAANERWLKADQTIGFFDSADIALDSSLLDSARRSALAGNDYARRIVDGLEGVLTGALDGFEIEYACGSGEVRQWFMLRASRAPFERGGAILSRSEITTRHEAEERARRDALRLKLALEAAFALSFEWDIRRDEARRFVSICEDLPVTSEEAPDTFEGVCQKVLPEDREHFRSCVRAAMESDSGHYACEFRLARPDGEIVWLAEKGRVERDATGSPLRLIGLAQDITDRKRAEESLRRQRDELDWLYRNAPIGLALLDLDLRYLRINQRLTELNGPSVEAHLGRRVQDVLPALAPKIKAITQRVRETRQAALDIEFSGETPASPGVRRFWNTSWHPHLGAEGEVIGFGVVVEETTERKRAELALRDRAARERFLVELGDRLRAFTDAFEIQEAACRLLGAHLDADRVYYGDVYEDQNLAIIRPDYFREGLRSISGHYRLAMFPEAFEALKTGRPLVINDTQDASVNPQKSMESYRALGIGSLAAAPLLAGGRVVWTLNVISGRRREWREEEVRLIVEVATRTWEAVKRALAESALRESEQRERRRSAELRAIFDTAPIGLSIALDRVGESIRGNRACEQLFGLPPGGELSKTAKRPARFRVFQNGRKLTAGEMPMQRAVRGEAVGDESLDIETESGERLTVFASAMPLYDEAGNPRGAVGAFLDITKMKRVEDALRESEERFRLLVESYAQAVWETEPNGIVVEDSPSWRAYTGQTREEWLGHGWTEALHPDDRAFALRRWREAVEARGNFDVEYRLRHRDEGWRWTNVRATPIIASDGSILKWVAMNIDIDARKRAEAALRESEAALRVQHEELEWVYQNAPIGLCILDKDLRFLRINQSLAEINGMPVDAHIGSAILDLLPELAPTIQAVTERILQTGEAVIDHEFSGETPASPGVTRVWNESWYPVRGEAGEIRGFGVVVEEVTERRKAEAALLKSEERYRTLFEKMDEGYCIVELLLDETGKAYDYRFLEANPAFEKQSGLANAVGRTMREFEPDLEPKWFETYGAIATTGVARRFEDYSEALGQYFDIYACRVGAPQEKKVAILFTDVTERKKAEAALHESELRLKLAIDGGKIGIFEWRIDKGEVIWDDRVRAQWGLPPGAPVSYETFISGVHPQDRRRVEEAIERFLDPREACDSYEVEYRVVRGEDREERWIAAAGNVFHENGQAVRLIGAAQDVTERKRVEEALKDADRRKDEFLATLAHELRNPLAPIRNAVHVMRHNALATQTDKRDLTLLSMIERQVEHLIRLVDDLLEVSRITRGKIELRMARVDLLDILSHALETAQPTIERGGHVLSFEKPSAPLYVEGDAVRLTQVFTNLLNNAAKYTPHGGAIIIRAERRGDKAVVTVRDSGVGIPAEMLPRVFDLFTQVDRSLGRSEGGLGIGLALVRSLLPLQGGSVEAFSDGLGRGSAFVVRLPALGEREAEDPMEPAPLAESTSRRILVIDDDHDVADSLVMFLETFGAEVRVAYSGAEGVEAVKKFRPTIVFLDLGMPQMDGYETARRIRALPEGRGLTLVALTGWGQDQIQEKARDCGFDRQITKPAGLEALQEVLASA